MLSDIENVRELIELLGDEEFLEALTGADQLVDDVEETLERVEQIEGDAEQAVREANDALNAVDRRLQRFDETIRLVEAELEAGFSAGFFFFALQQWTDGSLFIAAGLFVMGLLGLSSLAMTVVRMPQVQRLWEAGQYLFRRLNGEESSGEADDADDPADRQRTGPRIDWTTKAERDRAATDTRSDRTESDPGGTGDSGRRSS